MQTIPPAQLVKLHGFHCGIVIQEIDTTAMQPGIVPIACWMPELSDRDIQGRIILSPRAPTQDLGETLIHELAHAVTSTCLDPYPFHNAVWASNCVALGGSGRPCSNYPKSPWRTLAPRGTDLGTLGFHRCGGGVNGIEITLGRLSTFVSFDS